MNSQESRISPHLESFGTLSDCELDDLYELVQVARVKGDWGWAAGAFFRALDLALCGEICRREGRLSGQVHWRARALPDMSDSDLEGLHEIWEDAAEDFHQRRQHEAERLCSRVVRMLQEEALRRSAVLINVDREMCLSYGERWSTLHAS